METQLKTRWGNFELQRLPKATKNFLRAWDSADEYLLNTIKPNLKSRLLIFNDSFGALALALQEFNPCVVSDSYLSQQATRLNFTANQLPKTKVTLLNSLEPLHGKFDYVIIKVPKTLAFLEDFLIRLQPIITPDTQVIVAGMVKMLPSSLWKLLEKLIGDTDTSLAKKKARLIFVKPRLQQKILTPISPVYYPLENTDYSLCNHANVFSRERLDIGTRFLLAHLPYQSQAKDIVDLGCGNGVVGLMLAEKHTQAKLHFVDESFMAMASARENFKQRVHNHNNALFYISHALTEFKTESIDLIVCNPPFHQQNTIGDQIALTMFNQSYKVLKKEGQLWVIGNRHLGYYHQLKKRFRETRVIANNTKFVIICAIK